MVAAALPTAPPRREEPLATLLLRARLLAAVAAGLIIAMALKLAWAQRRRWPWLAFGLASFIGLALLRWPLLQVLALTVPVAVLLAWWKEGKSP